MALGSSHSCALSNKTIQCWGKNTGGQIGTNDADTVASHPTPQIVPLENKVPIEIYAATNQACAQTQDKTIYCWGYHPALWKRDQVSTFAASPEKISNLTPFNDSPTIFPAQLALSNVHSCVRLNDSALLIRCWGNNFEGQLGDGTNTGTAQPVDVSNSNGAIQIQAGSDFNCALLEDNTVTCWGRNANGRIAQPAGVNSANTPRIIKNLTNIMTIVVGKAHACAIDENKNVFCWGDNKYGQLGDGTKTSRYQPVSMTKNEALQNVKQLALGDGFTCILLDSGELHCVGLNKNGILGTDPGTVETDPKLFPSSTIFVQNPYLSNIHQIATGDNHICAVHDDNQLSCWGFNDSGQLGNSNLPTTQYIPTLVTLAD